MSETHYNDKQVYRVQIAAPIETVWSELVMTTKARPFFWNGSWDTPRFEPGQPYRITASGGKMVPVIGRIMEMDPPRRMVTSFRLTGLTDPASTVTYELEEKDGGTQFSLITENIISGSKSEKQMASGAQFIVTNFKAYVETGRVTFGARVLLGLYSLMAPIAPKSMSAENWPFDKAE